MALSRAHMSSVIEARGLWKVYETGSNQVQALRGVDLSIEAGEMVAIMGPSGCGKTTLLNCVSSLDEFSAGEVLVDGRQISEMSDRERTKMRAQRLGFVFQSFNLLPVLSAVENIELPLLMNDIAPKEARVRALSALESVGLRDWAGHLPAELSGGEQQRVGIARAVVNRPSIILADEPTGNLDPDLSADVMNVFQQFRDVGVSLLVASHDISLISNLDCRTITLEAGKITEDYSGRGG